MWNTLFFSSHLFLASEVGGIKIQVRGTWKQFKRLFSSLLCTNLAVLSATWPSISHTFQLHSLHLFLICTYQCHSIKPAIVPLFSATLFCVLLNTLSLDSPWYVNHCGHSYLLFPDLLHATLFCLLPGCLSSCLCNLTLDFFGDSDYVPLSLFRLLPCFSALCLWL